jgi:hypothetical protein
MRYSRRVRRRSWPSSGPAEKQCRMKGKAPFPVSSVRMSAMSSSALRLWMTSGSPFRARPRYDGGTRSSGPPASACRRNSRGRPRRSRPPSHGHWRDEPGLRSGYPVPHSRIVRMRADRAEYRGIFLGDRQQTVELADPGRDRHHLPTPESWARLTMSSRSSSKSAKSRWQCVSISMDGLTPPARRNAGTPASALRAAFPAPGGRLRRARRSHACRRRGHEIEQLVCRFRHERLQQDGDLAHDFGRDVEHGAHARRIGLLQRPRLLAGEIAVGLGTTAMIEASAVDQLLVHVLAGGGEAMRRPEPASPCPRRSAGRIPGSCRRSS